MTENSNPTPMASNNAAEINLNEQLQSILHQFQQQAPKETEKLLNAIGEIAASGISKNFLKKHQQAPDFTLPNTKSENIGLYALLRQGPVVLCFYRGEWCPFCNLALRSLQNILAEIKRLGATLVAISPQTPTHSLSTAEKFSLQFEVLSDAGNKVARRYGLVFTVPEEIRPIYTAFEINLPASNGDNSFELPVPATYIIDQNRSIRFAFAEVNYTQRLEPAQIVSVLRELDAR